MSMSQQTAPMQAAMSAPNRTSSGRGFGAFLRFHASEFLLVVLSTWCLSLITQRAFFLSSATASPIISLAGCLILVAVLFLCTYQRSRLLLGIVGYLILVALGIVAAIAFSTSGSPYADEEGNYLYLALCIIGSSTCGFLLTRTLSGSAVWFLAAAFISSIVQAFYQNEDILPSLVASLTALALIIFRNFRKGLMGAQSASEKHAHGALIPSVLPVVAAGAVALVVWFGVIAPLSPGVMRIYLITDYRQLPIVQLRGIADEEPQLNLDMTTNQLTDGQTYTTDDLFEGISDFYLSAQQVFTQMLTGESNADQGTGDDQGNQGGFDDESLDEQYNPQSYSQTFPWIVVVIAAILLIILLVVLIFALRRYLRKRRLQAWLNQEPNAAAKDVYLFLLERLQRVGITVPPGMTLSEFARAKSVPLSSFDGAAGVTFAALSDAYSQAIYGQRELTEDDLVPFAAYYLAFWKAARTYLGSVRYFFLSWRL